MGERSADLDAESRALSHGLDLGIRLIDTAEMYGEGGAEEVIAKAITSRRDEVVIVSKVYPHNASRAGMIEACERSLKRLKTDRLDVYLLHWRGGIPLEETLEGFAALQAEGKILAAGVSNFDLEDLQEFAALADAPPATNQVLFNLNRREAEASVLPWCQQRNVPLMAYCPLDQGNLVGDATLADIASRHDATAAQVALAWLVQEPGVVAIPKSSDMKRVEENYAAMQISLREEDLAALDDAFPRPGKGARLGLV